ncbi:MAG: hypothetical protein DME21_03555 [Verrucomicrobia bacterium]|nr:MAG: hypothetical protein DME21_03555 [Verrucomicrobiota bacterium]
MGLLLALVMTSCGPKNQRNKGKERFGVRIMKWIRLSLWSFVLLITSLTPIARAQISSYGVTKTGYYMQKSEAAPELVGGENHYFDAFVNPDGTTDIDGAFVQTPSGGQADLTQTPFYYFQGFPSQTALDSSFRNGTYTFQITTVDSDFFFAQLSLSGAYPSVPRLGNFVAAQAINAGKDFTLPWDPFAGGAANDFILVSIEDNDAVTVFQTPDYGNAGALTGQDTSVVIPAGTFAPGTNYNCYITFQKFVALDTSSIPGAIGVAAYVRETSVPLKTASSGAPLNVSLSAFNRQPDGSFQLQITGTAGAMFTVEATSDFNTWASLVTTNPPSGSFSFTDADAAGMTQRFYRAKVN